MRAYVLISGTVFGAVALAHVIKLFIDWPIQLAGWVLPVWVSWIAILAGGTLCAWAFRLVGRGRA
jgi:hypothetical protein